MADFENTSSDENTSLISDDEDENQLPSVQSKLHDTHKKNQSSSGTTTGKLKAERKGNTRHSQNRKIVVGSLRVIMLPRKTL